MAETDDCETKARVLRELFKGRFNQQEMLKVLRLYNNDSMQALNFLMKGDAAVVSKHLRKGESLAALRNESHHLNAMLEKSSLSVRWTTRMFACKECDTKWWRRVPPRKEVSTCVSCNTRYEAVPRDKEWGTGLFYCNGNYCQNEFTGFAVMNVTRRICNICGYDVYADHIMPPKKTSSKSKLPKRMHVNGGDGANASETGPGRDQGTSTEIDPQAYWSRFKTRHLAHEDLDYRTWSKVHTKTSSTVTTFLSQGSLFHEPTESW